MLQEEIESFKCSCDQGYEGYACDQLVDHCSDFPCDNGGNCTSGLVSYTCSCPTGKTQFIRGSRKFCQGGSEKPMYFTEGCMDLPGEAIGQLFHASRGVCTSISK